MCVCSVRGSYNTAYVGKHKTRPVASVASDKVPTSPLRGPFRTDIWVHISLFFDSAQLVLPTWHRHNFRSPSGSPRTVFTVTWTPRSGIHKVLEPPLMTTIPSTSGSHGRTLRITYIPAWTPRITALIIRRIILCYFHSTHRRCPSSTPLRGAIARVLWDPYRCSYPSRLSLV